MSKRIVFAVEMYVSEGFAPHGAMSPNGEHLAEAMIDREFREMAGTVALPGDPETKEQRLAEYFQRHGGLRLHRFPDGDTLVRFHFLSGDATQLLPLVEAPPADPVGTSVSRSQGPTTIGAPLDIDGFLASVGRHGRP